MSYVSTSHGRMSYVSYLMAGYICVLSHGRMTYVTTCFGRMSYVSYFLFLEFPHFVDCICVPSWHLFATCVLLAECVLFRKLDTNAQDQTQIGHIWLWPIRVHTIHMYPIWLEIHTYVANTLNPAKFCQQSQPHFPNRTHMHRTKLK